MKTMKKVLALVLACLMVFTLCACGKDEPAAPAEPGAPAAPAEKINLSFTIHDPATSVKTMLYQEMADKVAEETNGGLTITIHPSGTLVAGTDVAEGLLAGTADMGWLYTPFFTNQFPLTEVIQLPLSFGDPYATSMVIKQLYEEYPEVQEELANYKILNVYSQPGNLLYTKEPVHVADDLKGLNIRTSSNVGTTMIGAWGASVMSYGPGDIYEAMNKNVLDGFTFEYSGVKSFKLNEVCSYATEMPIMTGPFVTAMNWDSWNKLPAEYQEVLDKYFGWSLADKFATLFAEDYAAGKELCIETGVEIIIPTEEELATFKVAADQFINEWFETYTTDDFDAKAYFEYAVELYNKYLPDSPLSK